ncbi:MAG: FecR family protein [Ignavibacteria bacterium]|nr:FecR family protein [Ignavibacteria bacterium]
MGVQRLTSVSLLSLVLGLPAWAILPGTAQPVALVSKVILDVARSSEGNDWLAATRGEVLLSGDRIRTGLNSLAVIKFKDNSMVRVRERSELTVAGYEENGAFSKTLTLEKGVTGFSIRKQRQNEEFRFLSPTSVASVRGTGGQFSVQDSADILIVTHGLMEMMNNVSGETVRIPAGYTGISRADGTTQTRVSTPEEQHQAQNASRPSDRDNHFELDLRDNQGNTRKLRIEFHD